jgi:hypothetical protein
VEEFKKKDTGRIKGGVAKVAAVVARIAAKFVSILAKILGAFLTLGAGFGLAVLIFAAVGLVVNGNSPYVDFPLREIAQGALFYSAVVSAFFVGLVPLVLLILLGTSLASGKVVFGKMAGFSLVALWVVSGIVLANMAIRLAPQVENVYNNSEYYRVESRELSVGNFSKLQTSGSYEVIVYPSNTYRVVASGTARDLDALKAEALNSTLEVSRKDDFKFCIFCIHKNVKLEIYSPELSSIYGQGASRITAKGFSAEEFNLKLSGASRADLEIAAKKITSALSGASRFNLSGSAEGVVANISGASSLNAEMAKILNVRVEVSGASKAYFGELDSLAAYATGASRVYYSSAKAISQEASGSSQIRQTPAKSFEPEEIMFEPSF